MNKVLAERRAVKIFAMGIDVVECYFVQRIGIVFFQRRLPRLKRRNRGLLCTQNDIVDLALPWTELPRRRQRARDVGGIHGIFAGGIDHNDITVSDYAGIIRIMQHGGIETRSDNRSVCRALTAAFPPLVMQQG